MTANAQLVTLPSNLTIAKEEILFHIALRRSRKHKLAVTAVILLLSIFAQPISLFDFDALYRVAGDLPWPAVVV